MGYITRHSLSVEIKDWTDETSITQIISEFRNKYDGAYWGIDEAGRCNDSVKWYDAIEELKEFSKNYSCALFTLTGDGEESDDNWRCYVVDGRSHTVYAKLVYEEFDKSKLK